MSPNLPAVIAIPEPEQGYDGALLPVAQADTDQQLVELWVRRHESPNTRRNYRRQAERFLAFVNRPLAAVRLGDMQAYLATLDGRAPATRANAVAALKSLFSFAQETGFLRFNVGKAVKSPSVKNTLAERIMPEADMLRLIGLETKPRNRAILTLLYGGGLRISELCGLCWRDLAERQDGAGQATIYGKGGKTRAVLLSANTWRALMSLRDAAGPDEPVFLSREGGALDPGPPDRESGGTPSRAAGGDLAALVPPCAR
jgi:site-specific recombinase XerD